ncbi:MAG: asparaginase [Rhodospirillaceae bacterium]|nr:asparaginase [Rhodospirillaceae bacterium]
MVKPALADPILVEVTRGALVESRHRGAVAICDADGAPVQSWGDVERPIYPRSAVKPLQALPLIETGAADRFGLTDAEIALACASHSGEPEHEGAVTAWLRSIGLSGGDLECGEHWPMHEDAARALVREGRFPSAVHNNCSGKHSGFLTAARHLGEPTQGYIAADHPAQRRVRQALSDMCAIDLSAAPTGIDGCGIPTIAMPLSALARGMARLAAGTGLGHSRQAACARIRRAMTTHPLLVAGHGRFCTEIMAATSGRVVVKGGAEGVYVAALPERRLGIALKIADGASRAAETAMAALLRRFGGFEGADAEIVGRWLEPPIRNRAGIEIGVVREVDWRA